MIKTIQIIDTVLFGNIRDASVCVIDALQENKFSMITKENDKCYYVDIYEELID